MANETVITIVGNLTADPELRYTSNGVAVANFTIANTPSRFNRTTNQWEDGDSLFLRATLWREYAEHAAETLKKGTRVIATGALEQSTYEDKDGNQRTAYGLAVHEIGPALRYATATVTRISNNHAAGGNFGAARYDQPTNTGYTPQQPAQAQPAQAQPAQANPWDNQTNGNYAWGTTTDAPPF